MNWRAITGAAWMLLACCTVRADVGAAATRALTADKEPLPAAGPRDFTVNLPLVHKAMDGLPEEAGFPRLFSVSSKRDIVATWRRQLLADKVSPDDFQYIASGGDSGADAVLIGLTDGRVTTLAYFFPHLYPSKAASIIAPFQKAGQDPTADDRSFAVTVGGVRFWGRLTGERDWHSADVGSLDINGVHGANVSNIDHQNSYPVLIVVGINPTDWYILHQKPTPAVAAAIRAHGLVQGMTIDEANFSLGMQGQLVGDASGVVRTFQWTWSHPVYFGNGASVVTTDQVVTGLFTNGRLDSYSRVGG